MRKGARSLRRQAITESAVIFPVLGFSDGMFSIPIENRAESELHLDAMGVAGHRRIGPDLHPGAVGTDPRKRQRDGDVEIGGKPPGRLARGAVEYLERLLDILDVDVVFDEIGRSGQSADGLAGDHLYGMNGTDGRRRHGVETDQRAGRHHDLAAMFPRQLDQVLVLQQRADAEHDSGVAARYHRRNDRTHELARRAFDHDVGGIGQRLDRQGCRHLAKLVEPGPVLVDIRRRHGRKLQPVDAMHRALWQPPSRSRRARQSPPSSSCLNRSSLSLAQSRLNR